MGMSAGKFLEILNICKSLVRNMENASREIKLYARRKLVLNIYTRETDFAFATVQFPRAAVVVMMLTIPPLFFMAWVI
jgi:hypothetical protein